MYLKTGLFQKFLLKNTKQNKILEETQPHNRFPRSRSGKLLSATDPPPARRVESAFQQAVCLRPDLQPLNLAKSVTNSRRHSSNRRPHRSRASAVGHTPSLSHCSHSSLLTVGHQEHSPSQKSLIGNLSSFGFNFAFRYFTLLIF